MSFGIEGAIAGLKVYEKLRRDDINLVNSWCVRGSARCIDYYWEVDGRTKRKEIFLQSCYLGQCDFWGADRAASETHALRTPTIQEWHLSLRDCDMTMACVYRRLYL